MHYHDEWCETNNDYGLPAQVIYLFSFNHWGLFQPSWLQESTTLHLSLHTLMFQGQLALLWRNLPALNIWWDTTTHTWSRLQWWGVSSDSWPGWPGMVWGACVSTKYPDQKPHTCNPIKWRCQQPHPNNPIKWRSPQYLNSCTSQRTY